LPVLEKSLGPIPNENSVIATPNFYAKRKWPSSLMKINNPNTKIAIKI
jgi:hypothetical protein